ncbi:MAG: nuclear transport factor 2 family protein [Acidimicrobiales bacterium]
MTSKEDFCLEQVRLLQAGDVDTLIDEHYTEDAELIRFETTIKGAPALKEYFRDYVKMLGNLEVASTDHFMETDDTVFFDATVRTNLGEARVFDCWVMRGGKISHHFSGVYPS